MRGGIDNNSKIIILIFPKKKVDSDSSLELFQ